MITSILVRPVEVITEPPGANGWENGADALDADYGSYAIAYNNVPAPNERLVLGLGGFRDIDAVMAHLGQGGNIYTYKLYVDVYVDSAWIEAAVITDPQLGNNLIEFGQVYNTDRIGLRARLYEPPNDECLNDIKVRVVVNVTRPVSHSTNDFNNPANAYDDDATPSTYAESADHYPADPFNGLTLYLGKVSNISKICLYVTTIGVATYNTTVKIYSYLNGYELLGTVTANQWYIFDCSSRASKILLDCKISAQPTEHGATRIYDVLIEGSPIRKGTFFHDRKKRISMF